MRVVFLGTPEIAVPSLEAVVRAGYQVCLAVSQPDRPRDRGHRQRPTPVRSAAAVLGVDVAHPTNLKDPELAVALRDLAPDVFLVVAYGRMIPDPLLALAPDRWINMHPSLLPRYRGPAPIQGPLFNGDDITGVTTMRITAEMDAGDIRLQRETPIGAEETAGELHDRLAVLGAECVTDTLAALEQGTVTPRPQDSAHATYTKKLTKADGLLDFRQPARVLHNQVRAVTPWPGAAATLDGTSLRVWRAAAVPAVEESAPGTVKRADATGIHVATGDGDFVIHELQRPGKQRMTVDAFIRGARIPVGARFALPTGA